MKTWTNKGRCKDFHIKFVLGLPIMEKSRAFNSYFITKLDNNGRKLLEIVVSLKILEEEIHY